MAWVYLAVRASQQRIVEILRIHDVGGRVMPRTASGWAALTVADAVPEGVLGPLLADELGAVVTLHGVADGPEVVVRDGDGTARFTPVRGASPSEVATRLHRLAVPPVADAPANLPVTVADLERVLRSESTHLGMVLRLAPLLDLPRLLAAEDRQVVAFRGPASTVRVWAMNVTPVLLTAAGEQWQLAVPHPSKFSIGEAMATLLADSFTSQDGERVLLLGRYGEERSVALARPKDAGEAPPTSWHWDPVVLVLPPPHPRRVAVTIHWAFPESDVDRIERALTTADADRGLRDLLAALDVPDEAADVLTMPEDELAARSEGVGRGTSREIRRELAAPGVLPPRPPSKVTRTADRFLGVVWSVLGAVMVLLALVILALDVSLGGDGLLPRSPGPLLLLGLALAFLGWRQHRRGAG